MLRDYSEKDDKVGNNKRRIKQCEGKTKVEEKCGVAKDGDSEFKKLQCPVLMKAMILTTAVCSKIKHSRREAKYYG